MLLLLLIGFCIVSVILTIGTNLTRRNDRLTYQVRDIEEQLNDINHTSDRIERQLDLLIEKMHELERNAPNFKLETRDMINDPGFRDAGIKHPMFNNDGDIEYVPYHHLLPFEEQQKKKNPEDRVVNDVIDFFGIDRQSLKGEIEYK